MPFIPLCGRRSLMQRVAVCTLAGVLTTVLLAGALSWLDRTNRYARGGVIGDLDVEREGVRWRIHQRRFAGEVHIMVRAIPSGAEAEESLRTSREMSRSNAVDAGWRVEDEFDIPAWVSFPTDLIPKTAPNSVLCEWNQATGWPCVALRYTGVLGVLPKGSGWQWSGCFEVAGRRVGYLPVWSGLLIDTALHSATWFGVWTGIGMLRSHRRRRKGLCRTCAYDLAGLVTESCPECGIPISRPAPA